MTYSGKSKTKKTTYSISLLNHYHK